MIEAWRLTKVEHGAHYSVLAYGRYEHEVLDLGLKLSRTEALKVVRAFSRGGVLSAPAGLVRYVPYEVLRREKRRWETAKIDQSSGAV